EHAGGEADRRAAGRRALGQHRTRAGTHAKPLAPLADPLAP
ncbi:MAG: hypothetical protein AVDCRST_MAG52-1586, partial [uncultured Blastococcus sp.]